MSIEAMKRIKSLLQDGDKIDSHTISAVVAECDAVILTQQPATGELEPYDAGLLNDFGGGNVEWWQDYIRAELGHAHDFYQAQIATPQPAQATQAEVTDADIDAVTIQQWGDQRGAPLQAHRAYARAILALRPAAVPMTWPKARDVGRFGDMSPSAHMRVGLDGDNDVYVSVWDETGGGSIEFCTPGAGGGSSSRTRLALIDLMVAMEADNAERPDKDWWARRMGGITAQAKKEDE